MTNAFDVLALRVGYDVSDKDIQARYHTEMAIWHPDRAASALEKKVASQRSKDLNQAYQRLINPLHRAEEVMKAHSWEATPPGSEFFAWVLDQDINTFKKEWNELQMAFAKAVNIEDSTNASSLYGRMCYIYPRLQGK